MNVNILPAGTGWRLILQDGHRWFDLVFDNPRNLSVMDSADGTERATQEPGRDLIAKELGDFLDRAIGVHRP